MAERILKGTINLEALLEVQNKKILRSLQGRHSDISVEKLVIKNVKEGKRQRLKRVKEGRDNNAERMAFFKLKKEPEKNKTHWDNLLEEMKWMQNDFEKERKLKKKKAAEMSKFAKKSLDTRHLEVEKRAKKQEMDLKKQSVMIARSVNHYWKKIEKLTRHHYLALLQENKMTIQQNRLLGFINKLQKISGRVADSLPDRNLLSGTSHNINTYSQVNPQSLNLTSSNSFTSINENTQPPNDDDILILLKKQENGTFSILENNYEENLVAKAAYTAECFQPKGTDLSGAQINLEQPFLLKHALREYQLIGLHWLIALHDNKINGILADEMGLGKTIQTISLLAYLAGKRGNWGPHLIIVPTTIIINWEIEFKKWCPGLKILSYYGNQKERKAKRYGWHKPNSFNICITSYKLVIQDYSIFKRKRWYYIILDEAQNIKNFKSKRWQMLLNFKSKRKLLLTGTPLQNDVMEIWSYLHFLMPNLFYSNEEFRDWFYSQFYNAIHNNAALNKKMIQSLHSILRPFLLRRLKKDVEKQLPEKIEHVVYCELTRRQKYLYDEYINSDRTQDKLRLNDYFSLMNVLMQLRKVCNHPDLFETRDYLTPSKQIFQILFFVPIMILRIMAYDPLKSINLKNLNLILEDYEKLSKYEHFLTLKNFPNRPLHQIYSEINKKERMLFTPKYLIDENDILFKKQFTDSTILYENNTDEMKTSISYSSAFNLPFPNHVAATNIPLLLNTSMTEYFDVLHPINTLISEEQEYLRSAFQYNINWLNDKKFLMRKRLLYKYDLISRQGIMYKTPIYGTDIFKRFKINMNFENIHSFTKVPHFYGNCWDEKRGNILNSTILNKGFKYFLLDNEKSQSDKMDKMHKMHKINTISSDSSSLFTLNSPKTSYFNNTIYDSIYNYEEQIPEENISALEENKIINPNEEMRIDAELDNAVTENLEPPKKKKDFSKIPHVKHIKENYQQIPTYYKPSETIHHLNTETLSNLIMTPNSMLSLCEDLMTNYRIHIPQIISTGPQLVTSKYDSTYERSKNHYRMIYNNLNRIPSVQKYFSLFKIISFPDKNLVQYDSGKLIKLANLLKNLKAKKSKVLIFTQMTRMLDILERFLNLHGYTYVRLDGSTKVEVRQQVVDRFNNDSKVFCFISSTRSGGIGLNLTGADSIVFFDTDWNPAMDKQAQDRCHRIGQTRTVHIYRLITLSTIEENIFRKSIQKRELNYVIMEDGKFDMNNFQKINFKSIVAEENLRKGDSGENKLKKLLEFENLAFENDEEQKNIEQMLIRIEDQEDVQALKNLSKEMLDEYEKENNELQFIKNEVRKS